MLKKNFVPASLLKRDARYQFFKARWRHPTMFPPGCCPGRDFIPEAHRFRFFENGLGLATESSVWKQNRDFGGFRGTRFWNRVSPWNSIIQEIPRFRRVASLWSKFLSHCAHLVGGRTYDVISDFNDPPSSPHKTVFHDSETLFQTLMLFIWIVLEIQPLDFPRFSTAGASPFDVSHRLVSF